MHEDLGAGGQPPAPSTPPVTESVPPSLESPPPEIGSPPVAETSSPMMEQLEEQVIAEEYAIEQEMEQQQYPVEPTTPTTPTTPHEQHDHADPSTAPMDVTMDHQGNPTEGVAPTDHVIGNPDADSSQWTFQGANGYCGPNSISMLVEAATGQHVTEQQVASWAIENGEMTRLPAADDPSDIPSLHYGMLPQQAVDTLNAVGQQAGFSATLEHGDIKDLENTLKNGGEIMVEVDDQRLWHEPGQEDSGQANHFVVVTGIDPSTGTVFLNDPGSPYGKEESIPLHEFTSAWKTSDNAMIVTSSSNAGSSGGAGGGVDVSGQATPGPVLLPVTLQGDQLS